MVIEAGAKNGIFPVDEITLAYMAEHAPEALRDGSYTVDVADEDAEYVYTMEIDLSELPYMAAFPHLPDNTRQIGEHDEVRSDQVVIGSCTNGRLEDMRAAAEILRGRTVAPGVRCLVIPGSNKVWSQSLKEGLLEVFAEAGAIVSAATCGPCLGGHMGILAEGERVEHHKPQLVAVWVPPGSEVYLTGARLPRVRCAGPSGQPGRTVGQQGGRM
jgi:3-isopropylmalate/(R)-2-methylmalate dehydratase large subunit